MPPSRPITLIVATTPIPTEGSSIRLGIGHSGTLPWPRIKTDMSFFARVTSRAPTPGTTNAIIMGRKTYDSVPAHLRPLAKRISTIITRDVDSLTERVGREVEVRREKIAASAAASTSAGKLGKVFVIGGAEIYGAVLAAGKGVWGGPVRIVMTNVEKKGYAEGNKGEVFECDTFFPVDEELFLEKEGWRKVSAEEVTEWVGELVTGEWIEEGDVRVQMVGYERQ
ncbi:dihydrofolate reductase [Aspergillus niger ATCC 1015]|uniref:Dihydrofolate reductase n=1 Tax=Aspergillus niger (strain ATCC 1015 / CBS 113.46 / FGSC A1144 / LSHB Ac4 / NCTC 3858a / NRRL 328 / USDA 3528.7) TaxID=380704 RepID=G3XVI0_ASPNA|nr:dihydrofolate reductase [Aspergillus niger ATCC 1015]